MHMYENAFEGASHDISSQKYNARDIPQNESRKIIKIEKS